MLIPKEKNYIQIRLSVDFDCITSLFQYNISQHCWAQQVATCCDMLGVFGSNLKLVKFFMEQLWMLHDVVVVWPGLCNNVVPGHTRLLDFQHPICRNRVAKRAQPVAPNDVAIVRPGLANAGPKAFPFRKRS